jgi:polyisoprenoid-binding protein YceI
VKALAAAGVLVACAAAGAAPLRYVLDPEHTFVHFELLHFGTSTLRGRFGPVAGDVMLDAEAGRGELGLRIPLASVDTGVKVLDVRLRDADFLGVAVAPEAFFVASRFVFAAGRLAEVTGEFTLRGTSAPLTLRALRFACRRDDIAGAEVCGGDFEGRLKRSDFGITHSLPFVGDHVRLLVQVEGRRR